jgi:hypothetical protein
MGLLRLYWMHEELLMAYQQNKFRNSVFSSDIAARHLACRLLWNLWFINS